MLLNVNVVLILVISVNVKYRTMLLQILTIKCSVLVEKSGNVVAIKNFINYLYYLFFYYWFIF
jgi:hypothetical protein